MTERASAARPGAPAGPRHESVAAEEWLVSCSPERTLLARRTAQGVRLWKVFERGTLDDARAEARLAQDLAIEGIVACHDAGIDPATGKPYVSMDYHDGIDLAQWVARHGPLPPRAVARLARQLVGVLGRLHEPAAVAPERRFPHAPHGLVHRDVKPANLLLCGDDASQASLLLLDLEHAVPRPDPRLARPAPVAFVPPLAPVKPVTSDREQNGSDGTPTGARATSGSTFPGAFVGSFTGGTHGYAPPEAYMGGVPDAAFDAFGLGATLHFLLTATPAFGSRGDAAGDVIAGRRRGHALAGQPAALVNLIEACLAAEPHLRPTMAAVEAMLAPLLVASEPGPQFLDDALARLQAGDTRTARELLTAAQELLPANPRLGELRAVLRRRERLLAHIGGPPVPVDTDEPLSLSRAIAADAPRLTAFLNRFPAHAGALAARQAMLGAAARMLREVPPRVAQQRREGKYTQAIGLLEAALDAARAIASFPIGLPVPADVVRPGPVERDPVRFLTLTLQDTRTGGRAHQRLVEQMEAAEATLDLAAASRALDAIAGLYSGANEVVARLKDRLHRLGFYLERLAQPPAKLRALEAELEVASLPVDLAPLHQLLLLCAARLGDGSGAEASRDDRSRTSASEASNGRGTNGRHAKGIGVGIDAESRVPLGARMLHRTLQDLLVDFPHARRTAGAAAGALDRALAGLTDHAAALLAEAERKLTAVPIPIRPLQNTVNRVDSLRMLEALVDRPGRPRADLLEELEHVRMRVDQARATRDAIARGAREAMMRGHLTTALYDVARAVDQFAGSESSDTGAGEAGPSEADRALVAQLEETKRKKREVDEAIRAERALAGRFASLRDAPEATPAERLQVLEQRRQVLRFLLQTLQRERAAPYAEDLREVEVTIVQERSDAAERRHEAATDADERLRIARDTLEALQAFSPDDTLHAPVGRVQRVLEHWRHHRSRAEEELARRTQQAREREAQRRRRRMQRVLQAVVGIVLLVGVYQVSFAKGRGEAVQQLESTLARELRQPPVVDRSVTPARFEQMQSLLALNAFVAHLRKPSLPYAGAPRVIADAQELVELLGNGAEHGVGGDWLSRFTGAVQEYRDAVAKLEREIGDAAPVLVDALRRFAVYSHQAGLFLVAPRVDGEARVELERHVVTGGLPESTLGDLRAMWGR